jgi:Glycosyl hydrolase family 79 C-terminal beta domain
MKSILVFMLLGAVLASEARSQSPVTVTIETGEQAPGPAIPEDFLGLSFGMRNVIPDKTGGHFFSATNTALVTLFRNLGLKHLRVGGTSVESPPRTPIPNVKDIDSLFGFAKAAGVDKVIYSFRLLETNAEQHVSATNAILARYIWDRYRSQLDCFAVGNEPDRQTIFQQDWAITNFDTYLNKWRQFVAAITNAVSEARFTGPDAGSGNITWTTRFAAAEKDSGLLAVVCEHFYVGGAGRGKGAQQGLEAMLSPAWLAANERLYTSMAVPVLQEGLPYRFTEASDHFSGGIPGASDTYAGALWALDFLHWWAAHGTRGVDFHNTHWVANDVITPGEDGRLTINPKGYGFKAFDLGGHGSLQPLTLSNPDGLNLTAYAVRGRGGLFVTLINKEHGVGAREANVTLAAPGPGKGATAVFLTAPNGDVATKTGVTLGGASVTAGGPWLGKWSSLPAGKPGHYPVKVPAASAAVVRIPVR